VRGRAGRVIAGSGRATDGDGAVGIELAELAMLAWVSMWRIQGVELVGSGELMVLAVLVEQVVLASVSMSPIVIGLGEVGAFWLMVGKVLAGFS